MKKYIILFTIIFLEYGFSMPDSVMSFEEYDPVSTLNIPQNPKTEAKFPFIDVHSHQFGLNKEKLDKIIEEMDKLNMEVMVNLSGRGFTRLPDGGFGINGTDYLKSAVETVEQYYPGRIIFFTNVDFQNFGKQGWIENAVAELEEDVKNGAKGLKIYKNLGMNLKDNEGNRIPVDDSRLDKVWEKCGELGIPVLIHSADPAPFWEHKDKFNERWLELKERPDRYRDPEIYPPFEQIISEQLNVFRKHPNTIFINAHLGWLGNDLARLGKLMDEIPNMYTEIGAVLAELGRQPRFARQFFEKYQDRILFGKDSWQPEEYHVYFRVLETADEYFDYYRKRHAFWKMYGLDLPDEVLKKVYYRNALRIIPGINGEYFRENEGE